MIIHNPPLREELWELGYSKLSIQLIHAVDAVVGTKLSREGVYPSTKLAEERWSRVIESSGFVAVQAVEPTFTVSDLMIAGI